MKIIEYNDKYLEEVKENSGKCYLAIEDDKAIGLIMGYIRKNDEYNYLDYKCPKSGEISELIITNKIRNNGVGKLFIKKLEDYFKSKDCEYIFVDVYAYNEIAKKFYSMNNYHLRMKIRIKKINDN